MATAILTLIALLLMFLGGLLDGLIGSATGAYRAQQADLVVYSTAAQDSLVRSRITGDQRRQVEAVDGVTEVGGLGSVQLGGRFEDEPDSKDLVATVLFGYELAPRGLARGAPAAGSGRGRLLARGRRRRGGTALLLGPARTPVEVVGFVDDTRYSGQGTLWGSLETWREVARANRPGRPSATTSSRPSWCAPTGSRRSRTAIDEATGAHRDPHPRGRDEALPGVSQQRATFNQIIGVTVVIALVVVALFFALITVERTALYGILKAVGASAGHTVRRSRDPGRLVVTLVASAIGALAALALDAVDPAGVDPLRRHRRAPGVERRAFLLVASVLGCAFSLRRVLRIDPASAIG